MRLTSNSIRLESYKRSRHFVTKSGTILLRIKEFYAKVLGRFRKDKGQSLLILQSSNSDSTLHTLHASFRLGEGDLKVESLGLEIKGNW